MIFLQPASSRAATIKMLLIVGISIFTLAPCFSQSSAVAADGPATPAAGAAAAKNPDLTTERGTIELPITNGISKDAIKAIVMTLIDPIKPKTAAIKAQVEAELQAYADSIKASDPERRNLIQQNWKGLSDAIVANVDAQIGKPSAAMTAKINSVADAAAEKLKTAIDDAIAQSKLTIIVTGDYHYVPGSREPGRPGWQLVAFRPGLDKGLMFGEEVQFIIPAEASVGVTVTLPIKVTVGVDLGVKLKAVATHVDHPEHTSTIVHATPQLETDVTLRVKFGQSATVGAMAGVTKNIDLPDVEGTLTANGHVR